MADEKTFNVLSQCLSHLCPKLAPQIVPSGDRNARQILESIMHQVTSRAPSQASLCEMCGRAVRDGNDEENVMVTATRVLRWDVDLVKKCLKIVKVQVVCQDCQVLLNLQDLLTFFAIPKEEFDKTKLYQLACHFAQVNGHNSKAGDEDVLLLQQVVATAHALYMLSKNISDITVHGPDGVMVTSDSSHEVATTLLATEISAVPQSNKKSMKKKRPAKPTGGEVQFENAASGRGKLNKKTPKKLKKARKTNNMENGYHSIESDGDEVVELDTIQGSKTSSSKKAKKSRLALSEKKPKRLSPVVKQRHKKRRRSAPGIISGQAQDD